MPPLQASDATPEEMVPRVPPRHDTRHERMRLLGLQQQTQFCRVSWKRRLQPRPIKELTYGTAPRRKVPDQLVYGKVGGVPRVEATVRATTKLEARAGGEES